MDLPTYTNIWRIEKRLYKLYDLRLPMPLPIVWIGVFVGVLAPWSLFLYLIGLPFAAPWHVLYLVPPGVLTWLSTRPVIESKRLTELLQSQLRYMAEPRTWCRMAPVSEPGEITFTARVWRTAPLPSLGMEEAVTAQEPRKPAAKAAKKAAGKAANKPGKAGRTAPAKAPAAVMAKPPAPAGGRGRARAVEPWSPERAAPARSVPGLAAVPPPAAEPAAPGPPGTVHPAVAAAAAAAAPVADTSTAASWSTAAAPAKGLPPGHSRAEVAPGQPVFYMPEPSERAAPDPAPPAELPGVAEQSSSVERAGSAGAASGEPAAAIPPIGTEALRRLRRLAASAEPPAARPAALDPVRPTGAEDTVSPSAADAIKQSSGRDAVRYSARDAVRPSGPDRGRPSGPDVEGAGTDVDPAHILGEKPSQQPAVEQPITTAVPDERESASDEQPREPSDAADDRMDAREQHRKGQPPRLVRRPEPRPGAEAAEPRMGAPRGGAAEPRGRQQGGREPGDASAGAAGVSIRAVPAGPLSGGPGGPASPAVPPAPRTAPTPAAPADEPPRVRRVESVVGRDPSGGWRRLAQVVVGGSRTDGMEIDEARTRTVLTSSRRIMVLGCTGGAGQTTTALMLGHTLARYRQDRVLALDANTGDNTLTSRIQAESPETLSSLLEGSDTVSGYLGMRAYTTRCESGLEVVGADTDDGAAQRLADRARLADWRRTLSALDRHYRLIVVDPAASLAARLLPYADQLVLVAPASEDAPDAIAMTYEWLDGHGCSDLRRRAVMVINGVSRRSLPDVEQAEAVASGRCRAIVRVPWEDELAPGRPEPVDVNHLRTGGRRAYVALAGVIVNGLAAIQAKQEVAR
ncbi:TcpE family conjugal transfer membrane protein [Planotetraspora sp. A-T 1434]|uniref:TcpE family conjugal transfer membrane protein n=1 Tax=Planotetraspora sp. A-T 1434 TaxID=2979219 RepID=UPI0021BEEF07|nr:TcpE family conjugal transfer membrane protein [Planotetraspora sp. A-T 1434]MCT9932666.1 TcpE family conjugal transfer membrane protein [Planotetraspora sp. A-T 1434]